jgi:hypothetical protein
MIGAQAKVLRAQVPQLEVALSYQNDSSQPGSNRVKARVQDFTPSPNSQVLAIDEDESKAKALNRFAGALVLTSVGARLKNQPIDLDLSSLNLQGMAIQSISPLDPSGWVRVNLVRPAGQAPTSVAVAPATTDGPVASTQPVAATVPAVADGTVLPTRP